MKLGKLTVTQEDAYRLLCAFGETLLLWRLMGVMFLSGFLTASCFWVMLWTGRDLPIALPIYALFSIIAVPAVILLYTGGIRYFAQHLEESLAARLRPRNRL